MTVYGTHDQLSLASEPPQVALPDGRRVPFANLDYAATAPVVRAATDAVQELLPWYGSIHRGAGVLSQRTTLKYERARQIIADFLGCRDGDHVVFTRNTTDAMNLLAAALPADTLAVSFLGEHHATLLPWPRVHRLPIPDSPDAAVDSLVAALRRIRRGPGGDATRPILVAVTAASNVTGELWPIGELARQAHQYGARLAVDAAQLAPHRPVDLAGWEADYVAVSGHKLYAPFGCGILAGRADWLDQAPPYLAGGGATLTVSDAATVEWSDGPARHEAGTPNVLGAVALAAVCDAFAAADRSSLQRREQDLTTRLLTGLSTVDGVSVLRSFREHDERVGIVSFVVDGHDSADLADWLGVEHGIGVRAGLFCAHPFTRHLLDQAGRQTGSDVATTALRASIGLGTDPEHVDRLIAAVAQVATAPVARPDKPVARTDKPRDGSSAARPAACRPQELAVL